MAPDPPTETDSPVRCQNNLTHQNTSDESEDNEDINRHDGYEPLNMNENIINDTDNSLMDTEVLIEQSPFTAGLDMMDEIQDLNVGCKANEEPISVEAEVVAEVWNKPRPVELNFELDVNSQELIKSMMSSIQLPKLAAPTWAEGMSDLDLKETVLQKVRKRSNMSNTANSNKSKQD
uniref:Male-enhanced antigen 1 n=1 Tax=Culicoides sonorensis TaxID=179676 RepID=A0A336LPY2_CULSO